MKDYSGYFFNLDEENRISLITSKINKENTFTDVISDPDWKTKKVEIFIIALNDKLNYLALVHNRGKIATGKSQIRFTNLVKILPEIPLKDIETKIQTSLKQYFIRSSKGDGKRTSTQTWKEIIQTIKELRPQISNDIDWLYQLKDQNYQLTSTEKITLAEEKDAVNISLRIANFDEKEILNWSPPKISGKVLPFLKGIEKVELLEDSMIAHDTKVFGEWSIFASHIVGCVEFKKDNDSLFIINANRTNIEHTIGVDLIYYFERYESYLLMQYKRMNNEAGKFVYRPIDKPYHQEIDRIRKMKELLNGQLNLPFSGKNSLRDYRLSSEMVYFAYSVENEQRLRVESGLNLGQFTDFK